VLPASAKTVAGTTKVLPASSKIPKQVKNHAIDASSRLISIPFSKKWVLLALQRQAFFLDLTKEG
jgi:hypothetical protein